MVENDLIIESAHLWLEDVNSFIHSLKAADVVSEEREGTPGAKRGPP